MSDVLDFYWYSESGSIRSSRLKKIKSRDYRFGNYFWASESVAFNVGDKVANHIVSLHNAALTPDWISEYLCQIDSEMS